MNTKHKGDAAEQAAVLEALKLVYLPDRDLSYILPVDVFISYGSEIHTAETDKRQRRPGATAYRDAWELILQWAASEETHS